MGIAIEMNDLKNMSDTLVNSQFCGEYQQKVEKINDKLKQIKVSEAAVLGIWLSNENDTLKTEIEKADKNILFLQKSLDAVKTRKPIRDEKKKKKHMKELSIIKHDNDNLLKEKLRLREEIKRGLKDFSQLEEEIKKQQDNFSMKEQSLTK